jgi:hypothetical protein
MWRVQEWNVSRAARRLQIADLDQRIRVQHLHRLWKRFCQDPSHAGIRRIATGNPDHFRWWPMLLEQLNEIAVFDPELHAASTG